MKTVEQMLEELQADKCIVMVYMHIMSITVSVEQATNYNNKFEFKLNENLPLREIVEKAYNRYMKITNAAPELVPHRLPPPAHKDDVQDAAFVVVSDDIPF